MSNGQIIKWCLLLGLGLLLSANEQPMDQDQNWWVNIAGGILAIVSVVRLNQIDSKDTEDLNNLGNNDGD